MNEGAIASRYTSLQTLRSTYLERARDSAKLTIPALVPPEGNNHGQKFTTPYQSLGARGVNNMASKLLLLLLPPNASFFRLSLSDFELESLAGQRGMRGKIEEAFGQIERAVMNKLETTGFRVKVYEALKQLIVAGNVLCFVTPECSLRVYPLNRFVVKRDPVGNVLEIIAREDMSPASLPPELLRLCGDNLKDHPRSAENTIPLYTQVRRDKNRFTVKQEINGVEVPGSTGHYPLDESPWLPLRFVTVENEDYGRGYIEEYYGDLAALDGFEHVLRQFSAIISKVVFLVRPNATTSARSLVEAPSGGFVVGNPEDVSIVQADRYPDLQVVQSQIERLRASLSFAFLLNTSVQRNGERVTAEEIRYMAGELEDALGGIYSILSQEFQAPLVRVLMGQMMQARELPVLPKDAVKPKITTGLEALGRGHDLNKLTQFLEHLAILGPEQLQTYINMEDYITRVGTSLGIDTKGLVKTQEEIQQEQAAQQAMMMAQNVAPDVVKGAMQQTKQTQ